MKKAKLIKEEILKIEAEKKEYNKTIEVLGALLQQKDDELQEKILQLESKLSITQRQKYRDVQAKTLEDHIQYLLHINTGLSRNTALTLQKKQELSHDLQELRKLLIEADERATELETNELVYIHSKLTHKHNYTCNC